MVISLTDPRGAPGMQPPVQMSSFSYSFWGQLAKLIGWHPHLYSWRDFLRKILDPPQAMVGEVYSLTEQEERIIAQK